MNIPQQITAGDSASWSDEPFVDGHGNTLDSSAYTLKYLLRGPAILTLTAVADGTGWKTMLSTTDSATLGAGSYTWAAQLSKTGERVTIGSGSLAVLADLTTAAAGYDGRSPAEKALADAEAALADLAGSGKKVKAYKIGTREATYYTAGELIAAISYWRTKVLNERTARDIANGLGNPRNLMVRFK
jgi:hypothetical protein